MKYKKGDWCEFVNTGSLHKQKYKYLNSVCKITSENRTSDPKNYRVVFQDKKGKNDIQ